MTPLKDPITADIVAKKVTQITLENAAIKNKGAIFCQVSKINIGPHFIFFVVCGNQRCRGAAPIFRARAIKIIGVLKSKNKKEASCILSKENVNRRTEAKACTIKYLIAVSVKLKLRRMSTKGMKLRTLISNPSHAKNHELAETETKEPKTKKIKYIP